MLLFPSALLATALALAPVQSKPADARPWTPPGSDLAFNPKIKLGKLDNGMRFAWLANGEPKERCYLRLHVNVGSLGEDDSERGMAHFLEHMAFNGSKRYPAGTLIEWFQKHGMAFGADTNASTSFSETIYQIDLATSDEKALREGLEVLRDFAGELTLSDKEVDAEKGVIDAEERERDSAGYRVLQKTLDRVYAGTRVPKRLPIGTKAARDKFTGASIRRFYEKWYRPEQTTLVVVGDLKSLDPQPLIAAAFGDWKRPAAPLENEAPVGTPKVEEPYFAVIEKEIPAAQIQLARLKPFQERPQTAKQWTSELPLRFAHSMLNLRWRELAKKPNAPFLGISVSDTHRQAVQAGIRGVEGPAMSIQCPPEKWKDALAAGDVELRRAIEHGFEASELDEVRANTLRALDEAVDREKTRSSLDYADEILDAAENASVSMEPTAERALLKPAIEALQLEACNKALAEAWSGGTLVLQATGNVDLGADPAKALRETYEESLKTPVKAGKKRSKIEFAYASKPEAAGKVASRGEVAQAQAAEVAFENGVRMRVKKTDFKERQILVKARIGSGSLTLAPEEAEKGFVASRVFAASGLGAHSADEIRRWGAGKEIGVAFGVDEDAFELNGGTTKDDLLQEMELMCAYLRDPGWREDGFEQHRKQVPIIYEGLKHQHAGPLVTQFLPALYKNDPRRGLPPREEVEGVTVDVLKAWLAPILAEAPVTLTVVGDVDVDAAIAAAARTFGALPKRKADPSFEDRRKIPGFATGLQMKPEIETQIPKSLVAIVYPTTDGMETKTRRALSYLGIVVNDRLRIHVREKLGASYSPGAQAKSSKVFAGDGTLQIQAMADPDKADALLEACLAVGDALAKDGVTDEEVDRLRSAHLAQIRDAQRQNGYWVEQLSELHSRPRAIDDLAGLVPFFESLKAEQLTPLAKQYLKRERASVLVVSPKKSG